MPDEILFKPAALSEEEFARIASHAEIGAAILATSTSSTRRCWSCATTTSAGTAPAIPTG